MKDSKSVREYKRRRTERMKQNSKGRFDSVEEFRKRRDERVRRRMDTSADYGEESLREFRARRRDRMKLRKDAKDDLEWITVNGTHIPLDEEGKMTGPVAGKIEKTSSKKGSGRAKSEGRSSQKGSAKNEAGSGSTNNASNAENNGNNSNNNSNRRYVSTKEVSTATDIGGYHRRNKFKNGYGFTSVDAVDRASPSGKTMRENTDESGNWTEEREKLHSQIIDDTFAGKKKATGKPVTTFMGGGPASGKSYAVDMLGDELGLPAEDERILIDPDKIKSGTKNGKLRGLPEYDANDPAPVHEESSSLAKRMTKIAQENGYNVLIDGTGDTSVKKMKTKIKQAHEAGHTVNGIYTFVPMETALKRNYGRERSVPDEVVVETHRAITQILPEIAADFDSVKLYCTDGAGKPRLVAHGGGGKGLTIVDKKLYDSFLANGTYQYDRKRAAYLRSLPESQKKTKKQ